MTSGTARLFFRLMSGNTTIPVDLGLRNIYILPTGYGMIYLIVLGAMLTGSINYNNNLGFLLTFLLGGLGLTAMMHTYGVLFGLNLQAATAEPVYAGQFVEVEITVGTIDRARTGIRWYFHSRDPIRTDLKAGKKARIRVRASTNRRGLFTPGRLNVRCDYPLGLFQAWSRISPNLNCLVYPLPMEAPMPGADSAAYSTGGRTVRTAGVDDFQGLSAYQPGDSPRRIHWQSYSRGRGLYTKSFVGRTGAGLMLDMKDIPGEDPEKKLSILCFHVLRFHHQRRSFGLRLPGQTIYAGTGSAHRDRCLRALALFGNS